MCGFVVLTGNLAARQSAMNNAIKAIAHRGPDGMGTWRSPDGQVALGHVRLAVIDLSEAGAQPMKSADGRSAIAFNGEIYNHRELAGRLPPLHSTSDTEVLLGLLQEGGANSIHLLRGMFAFAYWNGQELLVVRDRLGIKPVYYAETPDGIVAASELAGVLASGAVTATPDLAAVNEYLTYLYVPPPRTGIKGIFELKPGHMLRWRPGQRARIERYWSIPSEAKAAPSTQDLRYMLESAIKAHLVSDVPVGVFLSGGLDSSSITALAARHCSGQLKTFTITFGDEGKYLDERVYANTVAALYSTDHREIRVEPDAGAILPEMVRHFGQPFGNPTAILTYALSKATRDFVKVTLAGDGGDELLGGYPRYQGVWLAELLGHLPSSLRDSLSTLAARSAGGDRGRFLSRLKRFLDNANLGPEQMYYRWVSYDGEREMLWADRTVLDEAQHSEFAFLEELRARYTERSLRDAAPLIDSESFLPYNVLTYGDRMSMAHALEVRVPFCDHLLVERLTPVPTAAKMPGGIQKGLFRWAMRKDLPTSVISHRKIGFNPPLAAWLRRDLRPLVEEYLSNSSVCKRGWFRPDAIAKIRHDFEHMTRDAAYTLWALVVLEAWMRWLETTVQGAL